MVKNRLVGTGSRKFRQNDRGKGAGVCSCRAVRASFLTVIAESQIPGDQGPQFPVFGEVFTL